MKKYLTMVARHWGGAILISLPVLKTNHYDAISLMSTRAIFNNAAVLPLILNHRNINQKAAG